MGKEVLSAFQRQECKKAFVEEAIQEGALSKVPRGLNLKRWEKQQNIGITYTFGDVNYEELGEINAHTTRSSIGDLNAKFLRNLWNNSSLKLQAKHPFKQIPLSKPIGLQLSRSGGGRSIKVKELFEKGKTPRQIQAELGISFKALGASRIVLKRWGTELPRIYINHMELKEMIEKETDDKKLQKILDGLSRSQVQHMMYVFENSVLTTVSKIAWDKGFFPPYKDIVLIAEKIKAAGIPIKIVREVGKDGKVHVSYYIVFTMHTERVAEVLNNDPDLQKFRKNPVSSQ